MITQKTKCVMCGEEIVYTDIRSVPKTCYKKICITNHKYQQSRIDPTTDYKPSPEEIKKW